MKEWLTIKELSEKTGIPDPTIRRYIDKFGDFFTYKGGARSKRYEDVAVKILIRIKGLYGDGYETDGIDDILRREFAVTISDDNVTKDDNNTATLTLATGEDILEIKKSLEEQKEFNRQQQEFNKALIEKLNHQEAYIRESLQKRDTQFMEHIRNMQEERKALLESTAAVEETRTERKLSFFERLFGKNKN
ncbi:MerR family transcriptional regulator [Priestia megaterium]|uniref:MerR family transcriptional regulator n=1 Tax=Priestia megaterium TaxID=1404 RepID=UPI001596E338|nr:MerR family transcriptional regulator [Priestia megaterium]